MVLLFCLFVLCVGFFCCLLVCLRLLFFCCAVVGLLAWCLFSSFACLLFFVVPLFFLSVVWLCLCRGVCWFLLCVCFGLSVRSGLLFGVLFVGFGVSFWVLVAGWWSVWALRCVFGSLFFRCFSCFFAAFPVVGVVLFGFGVWLVLRFVVLLEPLVVLGLVLSAMCVGLLCLWCSCLRCYFCVFSLVDMFSGLGFVGCLVGLVGGLKWLAFVSAVVVVGAWLCLVAFMADSAFEVFGGDGGGFGLVLLRSVACLFGWWVLFGCAGC
ncbi:hypothetical protein [Enterobacter sp. MGH 3]|uniref:hypothetical protein n=1 Tax=Enterobacter sp. MGH 3 TaxID=1329812 RepID=UPI0012DC274B|nr:hypothetical protein [Enterobacter sp. MGH 3]